MGRRPGKRILYAREAGDGLWDSVEVGETVADRLDC
jgi:hypothetical protein